MRATNKKVLLTGASGYIGSQLFERFLQKGMECLGVDRTSASNAKMVCFDLKNKVETYKYFNHFKPDVVFHLATHSALAYQNPDSKSFTEDARVLDGILGYLTQQTECRLFYFSTSYVYSGLPTDREVTEEDALKPAHPFGKAKTFFEQLILKRHPDSVIFRLFSVFGPGNYLFPNTVHQMVRECQETGKITVWGAGNRKMQYVFLQDVLDCCEKGLFLEPGIYNVGGGDYLTIQDTAQKIAKMFNGDVIHLKDKGEGETLPFGDNLKIQRSGDVVFTSFLEALKAYRP